MKVGREVGKEGSPFPHSHLKNTKLCVGIPTEFIVLNLRNGIKKSRNAWAEVNIFKIVANRVSVLVQARAALGKILKPTITNHLPTVKHMEKRKLGAKWKWLFLKWSQLPKGLTRKLYEWLLQ